MSSMKSLAVTPLIIGLVLFGGAPLASAQGMGGMMDGDMPMMMHGGHMGMGPGMMGMGPGTGTGMMGGMGPGMMGMGPGMGMMDMGPFGMLDLSDEQRNKINKIQDGVRKQHWEIMGKMMDEQARLRDLYSADEPDAKKVGAVYGRIFDMRRQMIESGVEAHNSMHAVLTKEQREQLRHMRFGTGSRGRMPMRGGMGMGP